MARKGDKFQIPETGEIVEALSDVNAKGEVLIQAPGLFSCFYIPLDELVPVEEDTD